MEKEQVVKNTKPLAAHSLAQDVADVEAALHNVPTDAHRFIRIGLLVLFLGFGGFMVWALTAPLDAGVPAPGTAVVMGETKQISHASGGTVKEIYVKEAQPVKKGDPLLALDDTKLRSEYVNNLQEYAAQLAKLARLQAEQKGAEQIQFPTTLKELPAISNAEAQMSLQRKLFKSRRAALQSELAVLNHQAQANEADAVSKRQELALLEKQLLDTQQLVKQGYAPRNELLQLQQKAESLRNAIAQAEKNAESARLKAQERKSAFNKEVETDLADTRKKVDMLREKVQAMKQELDHLIVRSPVNGVVNNLQVHTVGSAVRPAQPLMDIVPEGEKIVFKARVQPQFIDRVHVGQEADIQLGAYLNKPQFIIPGRVISVSPDLITPQDKKIPPYYEVVIEVTPEGFKRLHEIGAKLQPGLPATILIKTGERTLMEYLLRPLMKRLFTALKEA